MSHDKRERSWVAHCTGCNGLATPALGHLGRGGVRQLCPGIEPPESLPLRPPCWEV